MSLAFFEFYLNFTGGVNYSNEAFKGTLLERPPPSSLGRVVAPVRRLLLRAQRGLATAVASAQHEEPGGSHSERTERGHGHGAACRGPSFRKLHWNSY